MSGPGVTRWDPYWVGKACVEASSPSPVLLSQGQRAVMACSAQSPFQLLPLPSGKKARKGDNGEPLGTPPSALPSVPLMGRAQGRAEALRQSTEVLPGRGKPAAVRPMLWRGPGQARVWGRYLLSVMAYAACQPRNITARRWAEDDLGSCIWRETAWSGWDTGSCQGVAPICRAGRALLPLCQHWRQDRGGAQARLLCAHRGPSHPPLCTETPVLF